MANGRSNRPPIRADLYARIVAVARDGLARYYSEYPEMANDERAKESARWSMRGVIRILRLLDEYEIEPRERRGHAREAKDAREARGEEEAAA